MTDLSGTGSRARMLFVAMCLLAALVCGSRLAAQEESPAGPQPTNPDQEFAAAMAETEGEERSREQAAKAAAAAAASEGAPLNLWHLFNQGGLLMWPITALSMIAIAFAVERALALRRAKIIPRDLVHAFGSMAAAQSGFDPRRAYRVCQQYPSAAATVIKAMLLKVGRPHSEVEHAVAEASDREATRLYGNVRPIALAVSIAPLLGLLGTVQGMIIAFANTANAAPGINKATALATGIYTALVTTFAGLAVAIPAAILAHYFEGRILTLFRDVDELVQSLLPQVERYEGKLRISQQELLGKTEPPPVATAPAALDPRRKPAPVPER